MGQVPCRTRPFAKCLACVSGMQPFARDALGLWGRVCFRLMMSSCLRAYVILCNLDEQWDDLSKGARLNIFSSVAVSILLLQSTLPNVWRDFFFTFAGLFGSLVLTPTVIFLLWKTTMIWVNHEGGVSSLF